MRGRGVVIALLVSVAVNLFLISAGAAVYLSGRHTAVTAQHPGLRRAVKALPMPDRKPFVVMLRAAGAHVKPDNRRARVLRETAWNGLASGTETAEAIKAQLAEANAINQASRAYVEDAVVDYGLAMEPAGREALGQALRPSSQLPQPR